MQTQALTDEGLVQSILGGDGNAFSLLYERYRRPIYSAAYRIIRNSEDAQDATQEIAFKLYKSLHLWDVQKSKLSTWIYRIAANHSIDCYRARYRRMESPLFDGDSGRLLLSDTTDCSARSPFNAVKTREDVEAVLRCTGALPDLQRKIFIHRYFRGRKLEEIARIERCRLGTVKSALHRATDTVRRLMQKSVLRPQLSASRQ
ncbi:MAG: RNA polymerase sigma factor [Acidobacteria bacterium]|nr:RNA polymerase sigma factor [Acidobacteriota bacterium]